MAAMANSAPEPMPSAAGFQEKASSALLRGQDTMSTPAVAIRMASRLSRRHLVAEKRQAENRDLHGLGLGIGGRDDEGARLHGGEQQGRGCDLRQSGGHRPRNRRGIQLRDRQLRRRQHDGKKDEGEGQAEEKAHVRGADRAQCGGQLLLHGVAQHLTASGRHREDGP